MKRLPHLSSTHHRKLASLASSLATLALGAFPTHAALEFLGVAAGDATSSDAIFWTRAVDSVAPANTSLTLQISTDPTFSTGVATIGAVTDSTKDYTCKVGVSGLQPNTRYYYRFAGPLGELSNVGRVKTAPLPTVGVPLHFAFSGDNDGLMRPYALASVIPAQNLDFYINLGDVIYETASNTAGNNGAPWLNSPAVALSNAALTLNGIPNAGTTFATRAQLFTDYSRKYRENFLAINTGGQNCLQVLYAAQGNYTTWDNHELGNRKYIDGGAPAGGSVGGPLGNDMPTGRGVDARAYTGSNVGGSGNVNNVNDVNTSATDFMNRSLGFTTLEQVFLNYQPIADRGTINAPADSRTDGTKRLYTAQQWGKYAIYVNTDTRSYRDIRLKTDTAAADDTSAPRANNPARTYLGKTQLAWLEQTLLDAQNAGTPWKFVSISDPIDQLGPIGGALSGTLTTVNTDGGKSYMGGYRAERNALLKFIADHHIINVVFIATDDHQNRINELAYSPTGQTEDQSSYVKVPYSFTIVCGPLGATGPETITDHSFSNIKAIADSVANAQLAAGVEPIGLENYPGLFDLFRMSDPTAATNPQPVDFYSPDTFNFTVFDVDATGQTLAVKSVGMNSTAQNAGKEYANGPQANTIFSFKIQAASQPAFTACPDDITVGTDPGQCSALLAFDDSVSGFPTPTVTCKLNGSPITSPYHFPKGVNVVTCTAVNPLGQATCSFTVTVKDTEAPIIQSVTPSKTVLSPPNHKMVPITLAVSATDNCGIASLKITDVTSNEPLNGAGDGNTSADWQITGNLSLDLRAERSGTGSGRVYKITVEATDAAGNKSQKTTTVTVPH